MSIVFVPRDAGFFSVFNYYIGMLCMDKHVYPFWNSTCIKKVNKIDTLQHFCYLDNDVENSWFEFFKPVTFTESDDTHKNMSMSNVRTYPYTNGNTAAHEFLMPKKEHFLGKDIRDWRQKVHQYFSRYIQPSDKVNKMVEDFITDAFPTSERVIAVHYRHPSHCCEEGLVLISRYFEKIDEILIEHPNAFVFLATDTEFGVVAFKHRYGDKLIYNTTVMRTSLDNLLEWAYARGLGDTDNVGFIGNKGYELQHVTCETHGTNVQMGYDVLIDALCIAKCDWFVHTVSNVSFAVSYMNPKIDMIMI